MVEDLKVGNVSCKPGRKVTGYWKPFERMDGLPENIAVQLVNGSKPGPKVWVSGCHHGDEVFGAIAVQKVFNDLDPSKISGSVICVPVSNPSSFWEKARCSPYDGGDLERLFPGNAHGTYTQRLAHAIIEEGYKCDCFINLHGASAAIRIIEFAVFDYVSSKTKDANREIARSMDVDYAFGFPEVILGGGLHCFPLSERGIPSMAIEGNDPEYYARNIMNILKHLRVLPEKPTYKDQIRINKLVIMNCKHGGIFMPKVDLYDRITKGQLLAEIVDFKGDVVEEITSTIDGMIMTKRIYPIVKPSWSDKLIDEGRKYPGKAWEDNVVFELAGLGTKEDW